MDHINQPAAATTAFLRLSHPPPPPPPLPPPQLKAVPLGPRKQLAKLRHVSYSVAPRWCNHLGPERTRRRQQLSSDELYRRTFRDDSRTRRHAPYEISRARAARPVAMFEGEEVHGRTAHRSPERVHPETEHLPSQHNLGRSVPLASQLSESQNPAAYLAKESKLCPNCRIRGQRIAGCDHMKCKIPLTPSFR